VSRRPNTSLAFPATDTTCVELPPIPLRPAAIREALKLYPDQSFVDTLCDIATHGARISYEGPLLRVRRANHGSALATPDIVTEALHKELMKGRLRLLDNLPNKHYFCSPIGLVPKKTDGIQAGWRVIFDLSCPDGRSVNDGIPKEYGAIVYELLSRALELVARAGRWAVMIKRDLKSAFRHVPVSPTDYWCLIFEWQGRYYVDIFLPFGLRTSPRIFNLYSEAIHWILEYLHGWAITHYLDDFLAVFPPRTVIAEPSQLFDDTLDTFGLTKAPEKDQSGCVVTHLGFEIDSMKMEVCLPPIKHQRAISAVDDLLSHNSVS